jgi:hypothetical protein
VAFIKATQQSVHPTLGSLARFQTFFYASAFFQSDGVPPPDPARVTQTVRQPKCKSKSVFVSQVSFYGWFRVLDSKSVFMSRLFPFLAVVFAGFS